LSGGGVYFVGRNHPQIRDAIREVNEMDLPNLSVVNSSILGGLLAEKLIDMAGPGFSKVQYSNSGAEANEVAIRFSRFCTRKRRFLFMEGAFHGRTYGAISLCGFPQMKDGMDPKMPVCTPITPNDIKQLEYELSKGDVAALFYEYCQGMTLTVMEHEYLQEARRLCDKYGTLLVADEVQTGFARMGDTWFAFQKAGVVPDMVTLSKTLSGGAVPISATLVGEHVYNRVFKDFKSGPIYFSTFAENNLSMAAGLATVNVLQELDARKLSTSLSDKIRKGLMEIAGKYDVIDRVAGHGLMIGVYFKSTNDSALLKVQQTILGAVDKGTFGAAVNVDMFTRHNIVVQIPGPDLNAIKILPPVNLSEEDVNYFLASFEETIANMYTRAGGPAFTMGKAVVKDAVRTVAAKVPGKGIPVKKPQPAGIPTS
jgi:ornithine--oxo-acid transaminase